MQALRDEGENPEEYLFEISKGKPSKPITPLKQAKEVEKEPIATEKSNEEKEEEKQLNDDQQPKSSEEPAIVESTNEVEANAADQNGESNNNEDELILKDEEFEEIAKIGNNQEDSKNDLDNDANIEDSLNLTIGEEEEQLLRDDDDIKPKGKFLNSCLC